MKNSTANKPSRKVMTASATKGGLSGVAVEKASEAIPFIVKGVFVTLLVVGTGFFIYRAVSNRFIKLKENGDYPDANITQSQASTRADAIVSSLGWFTNSFETVANNMSGLNYNAFVRLYNAFGHQSGTLFSGKLNLVEWIKNQFSDEEIQQLSFLTNGVFFRTNTSSKVQNFYNSFFAEMSTEEKQHIIYLLHYGVNE